MPGDLDFSGKAALVTGSSRGIGAAIVREFNERGCRCIVNYVADSAGKNRSDAEAIASELKDPLVIGADVGDNDQVMAMFERIQREVGELDILVNNAGILRDRTIKKMAAEDWDAVLRVNLSGVFHCMQAATPLLKTDGRIVNLASVTGVVGLFGQANYAASKAGVIAITRVAAREFARQRITVNAIAPGFIDTDMTRGMPGEVAAQLLRQVPLERMGRPEDVAQAVLFLCSPMASYITGQVLHVNGGFFMG